MLYIYCYTQILAYYITILNNNCILCSPEANISRNVDNGKSTFCFGQNGNLALYIVLPQQIIKKLFNKRVYLYRVFGSSNRQIERGDNIRLMQQKNSYNVRFSTYSEEILSL